MKRGKRAQVTIFITIGIILVVAVSLFLIIRSGIVSNIGGKKETSPNIFLLTCLEGKIKEGIEKLSLQGGDIDNSGKISIDFLFKEEGISRNISYLCYNQNYYGPQCFSCSACVAQEPLLIQHIKNELHDYISDEVDFCMNEMKESLEKQGFETRLSYTGFNVEVIPKKVSVNIEGDLNLENAEESSTQKNFRVAIASMIYDLASVSHEIADQEARYCNFENAGYMILYPEWKIDIKKVEGTKIYSVKHVLSKEKFRFAIRSCVFPYGF